MCGDQVYSDDKVEVIEVYALFTIKAMYAFAYGFSDYAYLLCPGQTDKANCKELFDRTFSSSQQLKESILNSEIPDSDENDRRMLKSFNSNYDGIGGYEVFSMQYLGDDIVYVKIFEFKANTDFRIADSIKAQAINEPRFYIADESGQDRINSVLKGKVCDVEKCASFCEITEVTTLPPSTEPPQPQTVAFVLGSLLALFVCIAIGLLIWKKRRQIQICLKCKFSFC